MACAPLLLCTFGQARIEVSVKNTFLSCRFDRFDTDAAAKRCSSVPACFKPRSGCTASPRSGGPRLHAPPRRDLADGSPQKAAWTKENDARHPATVRMESVLRETCAFDRRKARPTKKQRELYRRVVADWEGAFLRDPWRFDFNTVAVPAIVSEDPGVRAFLLEKVLGRLRRLREEVAVAPRTLELSMLATSGSLHSMHEGQGARPL